MTQPRRRRPDGELEPDRASPRWATPLPADRRAALPYLFVPPGTLVTPYARRRRGLTDAEQGAVTVMRDRVAAALSTGARPAVPHWINPVTCRSTPIADAADAWVRRQLADHHAVTVRR